MDELATIDDPTEEYRALVRRIIRSAHDTDKGLFKFIKTCITECETTTNAKKGRQKPPKRTAKQKAEEGLSAAALQLRNSKASDLNSLSPGKDTIRAKTSTGERGRLLAEAIEENVLDVARGLRDRRVLLLLVRHEVQVLTRTTGRAHKHAAAKEQYASETGLSLEQVRQYCQDGSKYEILLQELGPGVIFTLGAGKTLWEERLSCEQAKSLDVPLFAEQAKRWGGLAKNFICEEYQRRGGDPEELLSSHTALGRALWKTPGDGGNMAALLEAANAVESAGDSIFGQAQEPLFGMDWDDRRWLSWEYVNPPLLNEA